MKLTYTEEEIQKFRNHAESLGYIHDIKVNVPITPIDFKQGHGEGCFILVNDAAKKAYDENEAGTIYEGILDNDSCDYIDLKHGALLRFEMRGALRPVVLIDDLQLKFRVNLKTFKGTSQYNFYKKLAEEGIIKA